MTCQNGFVLRLSADLTSVPWAKSFGGDGEDYANGLAVDASSLVVSGAFQQTFVFESLSKEARGEQDAYILHLPKP